MPQPWGSLRVQFILLVILAAIAAFGITVYRTTEERARETVAAESNALNVARLIASEHERQSQQTSELLSELGREPAVLARDGRACSARLVSLLDRHPIYANLVAFNPDGTVLCSAIPSARPTRSSDSSWFRRVLAARDFVVGDYIAERADGGPGQPMALSIRDGAGQVRVVLMAALDLEWLGDFVAKTQLTSNTTITVRDRTSTVVTRYPDAVRWAGKEWAAPGVRLLIGTDEMTSEGQDIDGSRRLLAVVPLGDTLAPIGSVVVGIPADDAYAASTIGFWRNVAALAVTTASVLGIMWVSDKFLIGRQVRAIAAATQALAAGRSDAPKGIATAPGELGELAASIDQMAEALENREKERRHIGEALVVSEQRYRDLMENASDLILSVAADGHILYANRAWREALGYDGADSPSLTFWDTIDLGARAEGERLFQRVMSGERMDEIELTFVAKDGHKILVEGSASGVDGTPHALRGIFRNVTSRKQAEAKLIFLSSHDALTGLYNRGYFEEEMARLARARRFPISIVVADVDGLKHTNDTLGHAAGDELLKQAARIMCSSFGQEDTIARIGGDEFAVLLPQGDVMEAEKALARVRQNIAARNASGKLPPLHLSLGTATTPYEEFLTETLAAADAAMYADKASRQQQRDSRR